MHSFDRKSITSKREKLEEIKKTLKTEFFGMDHIIDRVVNYLQAWFIFPELITRPVIINLWGMTGTGKTQLVRRLSKLLGYKDKFIEVQMDGFSNGSGFTNNSISSILGNSSVEEGERGILLLDEFQRFRTVDDSGADLKVERFQDVWMLLSDGRFSSNYSAAGEMDMMMASHLYSADTSNDDDDRPARKTKPKFMMSPWHAKSLKRSLKLPQTLQEIMKMSDDEVFGLMLKGSDRQEWEADFRKMVVFICGNLDEVFIGSANRTEDCDTDADIYHEMTKRICITDVKNALKRRFKPEQIARLGSNHVIYPSLSKSSYQKLIMSACSTYLDEMKALTDMNFTLSERSLTEIYDNSVFPTQGTRPVFSSIHKIFSAALSDVALWGVEHGLSNIGMDIVAEDQIMEAICGSQKIRVPIELELRERRRQNSIDFKTVVSVHEAGHALVSMLLNKVAPLEIKTNIASYKGGFVIPDVFEIDTKQSLRNRVCVYLAGYTAEEMMFGTGLRTTGAGADISAATGVISHYVRRLGFDGYRSFVESGMGNSVSWNTSIKETDAQIETIMCEEQARAQQLLTANRDMFIELVELVLENGTLNKTEIVEKFGSRIDLTANDIPPYHKLLRTIKE